MEVAGWKEPLCPLIKPFGLFEALALRAVAVAAGIVGDGYIAAALLGARVHMASEMSGAASLDIFHGLLLLWAEMMRLPVIFTVAVEDPGDFKGGPFHDPPPLSGGGLDHIERTYQFTDKPVRDVGVAQSGFYGTVAKEDLQDANIGSSLHQVCCKTVAEGVHGCLL
jgi:hypothetical protein